MQKKPALRQFIEKERQKGTSEKDIQHKLLDAGWHMDIIHHAMEKMGKESGATTWTPAKSAPLKSFRDWIILPYILVGIFLLLLLIALFI